MGLQTAKIWDIQDTDSQTVELLAKELGVSRLTATLLVNRNILLPSEADRYLNASLSSLTDPMKMADIEKAARRVIDGCMRDEKIFIYADYDVDGATSAAILFLFLKEIFPDLHIYIHQNDRRKDGYGVRAPYIRYAARTGYSLIVTVDCGISNFKEIEEALSLGVDVIVTDHHMISEPIPRALAVMNPQREDCPYPFKGLAGVGVVFALLCALRKMLREEGFFKGRVEPALAQYLDLVSLGTVADLCPLTGDNRVLVRHGLKEMRNNPRPGIRALIEVAGIKSGYLTETDIGFRIGPRLNAAGRIGDSMLSSAILVEQSYERSLDMARTLSRENSRRQREEKKIFDEAIEVIEGEGLGKDRVIVVWSSSWNVGIVGIVASKILNTYNRPSIVFGGENGVARGSGRSGGELNILKILDGCSSYMEGYGGHPRAAGLSVRTDRIEEFRKGVNESALDLYGSEEIVSTFSVDGEVSLEDLDGKFLKELDSLSPFGSGNPEPLFYAKGLLLTDITARRRGAVTFCVTRGGLTLDAVAFNLGVDSLSNGCEADILFSPKESVSRGRGKAKLMVKDFRFH